MLLNVYRNQSRTTNMERIRLKISSNDQGTQEMSSPHSYIHTHKGVFRVSLPGEVMAKRGERAPLETDI